MSYAHDDQRWLDELVRLGGSIHQDEDEPLSEAEDARQQADIARYLQMLDAIREDARALSSDAVARAVLWSLHPIEDYGIYQAAYDVLRAFEPDALVPAAAAALPEWVAERGNHPSLEEALATIAGDADRMARLLAEVARWDAQQRAAVFPVVASWTREDEAWEPLLVALGGEVPQSGTDPMPEDWPEDWRAAALAFRQSGRVDRAWLDERSFASNFDRVLALMELGHGARWRDVPAFLNPLLVRRRAEIPGFIRALQELPEVRRARVLAAVARAQPDTAAWLSEQLEALDG